MTCICMLLLKVFCLVSHVALPIFSFQIPDGSSCIGITPTPCAVYPLLSESHIAFIPLSVSNKSVLLVDSDKWYCCLTNNKLISVA